MELLRAQIGFKYFGIAATARHIKLKYIKIKFFVKAMGLYTHCNVSDTV